LFIFQERRLKERNQGQQQQGRVRGYDRESKKGVHLAYFAGAPAEGEESGATTAGAGAWTQQEVQVQEQRREFIHTANLGHIRTE